MQLTFNSQSQRKVTAGLGDFQIFSSYLLGVVATEWNGYDKGSPKAKILSWANIFSQLFCGIKRNCVKSCKMFASVEFFKYFCRWVRDVNGQKPKMLSRAHQWTWQFIVLKYNRTWFIYLQQWDSVISGWNITIFTPALITGGQFFCYAAHRVSDTLLHPMTII